jgi:prepilin-type processing-associated H-X9-DG protein
LEKRLSAYLEKAGEYGQRGHVLFFRNFPFAKEMRNYITGLLLFLILTLVGGLLVSGVAKVRDAANRASCTNNLHQIGVATHNYQSTMGRFPKATFDNPSIEPEHRLSWLVSIVPFVEADNLYSKLDKEKGWDSEENRFAAVSIYYYRCYRCPGYHDQPPVDTFSPSHYWGITGIGADAAKLGWDDALSGLFGYERKLEIEQIKGHTSNLLVALETSKASGAWTAGGPPTVRGIELDCQPYLGRERPFGGNHPNVTNALFADASVRALANLIDPKIIEAAATIQGSKEIEEFPDD